MRILVRYLSHKTRASDTRQDVPLVGAKLRIGRGTDQEIHLANLRVALAHAELIEGQDGKIRLQAMTATGFQYNGTIVQAAVITQGDQIDLGGFLIRVGAASGCDLALEISEDPAARGRETELALLKRAKLNLSAAGLKKRPWALGLAGGIAVLFLLIPLIAAVIPSAGKWLRWLPLMPSDHAWSSGAVSSAHAHFGTNCNACHTLPFIRTRNAACLACHKNTVHHVEAAVLKQGMFEGVRCASCHREHMGKTSLVRHDEGLCVKCHGTLTRVLADTKVKNVRNFSVDHPEFRPALIRYHDGKKTTERVSLADTARLKESPGVEFSHQHHLQSAGIASPTRGTVKLSCAYCHQVEPGGGRMQPITFKAACNECHKLNIPGDVAREVPHGDIAAALAAVDDYYAAWALRGGYPNAFAPASVQTRRRPGHELTVSERKEALDWAQQSAKLAAAEMFAYTTCGVCHLVEPTGKGEGAAAWKMAPVNIPRAWFPQSHFSHHQHDTLGCADCHKQVPSSDTSADVLLPGIESCRICHGSGDAAAGKLASTCVTCHKFHRATTARLAD